MGAAFSVFFKYFLIVDVANRICRDLDAASPDRNGLHWPRLRPLTGVRFPDTAFAPDELALFAEEKGALFAQKPLVARNHAHLLEDLLTQCNRERRSLSEELRLRGLVEIEGTTGHISIDPHSYRELAPKITELDDLAKTLWDVARKAKAEFNITAELLGPGRGVVFPALVLILFAAARSGKILCFP
ncbi:MAG: hypothetical protein ABL957_03205 [Parvularculaceae bacterium]